MAFDPETTKKISNAKVFMVGAGGIGCELLKNLLLTGFRHIELIDLDTIEVSNLNRQFLFRSEHVGKPKAEVAAQSARELRPDAKIVWYHESVIKSRFNVKFFSQFDIVMNALDNTAARSHVNRMCLAAGVPLIESGSSGYLGNCKAILKGKTECFDCQPPVPQKTFPGCTIRNTPSESIHCIVWAKHLFNQLFGEADPDQDVSPDSGDPEVLKDTENNGSHENGEASSEANGVSDFEVKGTSTRARAVRHNYNPLDLFQKLFKQDIAYLLSMDKLWETRRKPEPLGIHTILKGNEKSSRSGLVDVHEDKRVWSTKENASVFIKSIRGLKTSLDKLGNLVWDKDDDDSMDFVTACSNLRSTCFGIPVLSRYDIKQMAGNIIPAIASTNAMVAGFIIFNAIKLLQGKPEDCRNIITKVFRDAVPARDPKRRVKIVAPSMLQEPFKSCVSCSDHVEVGITLNVDNTPIKDFQDKILKGFLRMSAPDVELNDGSGTIIISSEDEGLKNKDKPLKFFKVEDGTRLRCEDFLQGFSIVITITHADKLPEDALFIPTGDLKAVEDAQQAVAEPVSSGVKRKLEELGVETVGKKPKLATPASTEVMEIVL